MDKLINCVFKFSLHFLGVPLSQTSVTFVTVLTRNVSVNLIRLLQSVSGGSVTHLLTADVPKGALNKAKEALQSMSG